MKSVAVKVLCVSAVLVSAAIGGYAQQAAPDPKDPRVGLKPGLRDAGVAAKNMELVSTMPRPEGFYNPKAPAGDADSAGASGQCVAATGASHTTAGSRCTRSWRAGRTAARRGVGLCQLGSRLPRDQHVPGQFPRLQHLRHRERQEPEVDRVDRLPRRAGRRLGARQPAVHVGRAEPRPHRLRRAGRGHAGQQRALPRHPHFRHQRFAQAETGRGGADLPRLAHAHARDRSEEHREHLRVRVRHRSGPLG